MYNYSYIHGGFVKTHKKRPCRQRNRILHGRFRLFHVAALHRRLCGLREALQNAARVAAFKRRQHFAPLGENALDLGLVHRRAVDAAHAEDTLFDVDLDQIAFLDERDRPALGGLGRDVAGPRLAPEKRPSVRSAMLAARSGSLEIASVV